VKAVEWALTAGIWRGRSSDQGINPAPPAVTSLPWRNGAKCPKSCRLSLWVKLRISRITIPRLSNANGQRSIRGMRIRVSDILLKCWRGMTMQQIMKDYPTLRPTTLAAARPCRAGNQPSGVTAAE